MLVRLSAPLAVVAVIEWIIIVSVAYLFGLGIIPVICTMLRPPEPYLPGERYSEDFAARLSGIEKPDSETPWGRPGNQAESGDVVDVRSLGTGPSGTTNAATRQSARTAGRSGAEKDRPLHLIQGKGSR
jgi:hypothetical protein